MIFNLSLHLHTLPSPPPPPTTTYLPTYLPTPTPPPTSRRTHLRPHAFHSRSATATLSLLFHLRPSRHRHRNPPNPPNGSGGNHSLDVRPLLLRVLVTHLRQAQAPLRLALLHPQQPHSTALPPAVTVKAARAPVPRLGTLLHRDLLLALCDAAQAPEAPLVPL